MAAPNRRRSDPGYAARPWHRTGRSNDALGRLAVVAGLVVLLLAAAACVTGWRYDVALGNSRVAFTTAANKHRAEQAVTVFWHEREAMNEYLLHPSPSLFAEVTARRQTFDSTIHGLDADELAERRLLLLAASGNGDLVRTFVDARAAVGQGTRAEANLVAALGAAEANIVPPLQSLQESYGRQAAARQANAERANLEAFIAALVAAATGIGATLGLALYARRLLHEAVLHRFAEGDAAAGQREFADALQNSETGEEADLLLKRQLERSIGNSVAVVLRRNNSENRLEAAMAPGVDLALRLTDAVPRSCLAVRLGRPHEEGGREAPLLRCEICASETAFSTCQPLLVAGEVIGSALVLHDRPLADAELAEIASSVGQAGPVLANLRNLALAEFRAATDALTGLPNHRAVEDTLKRMVAHAARTDTPMAAIMLDLDHFKQINDKHGHGRGDDVLAAIGSVLAATIRTSDFAGRNGGEEFVVVLPETGRDTALVVAEKIRKAIEGVVVASIGHPVTASLGVAIFPDDAGDSVALLRQADRFLYAAKANGRNRVEAGSRGWDHAASEL